MVKASSGDRSPLLLKSPRRCCRGGEGFYLNIRERIFWHYISAHIPVGYFIESKRPTVNHLVICGKFKHFVAFEVLGVFTKLIFFPVPVRTIRIIDFVCPERNIYFGTFADTRKDIAPLDIASLSIGFSTI